jgi:acyl-CoA dehydrogenase
MLKLSILRLIQEADTSMLLNIESMPINRVAKWLLRLLFFPFSVTTSKIDDKLIINTSRAVLDTEWIEKNLSTCICANLKDKPDHPFNILFKGFEAGKELKFLRDKAKKAGYKYQPSITLEFWLQGLVDNKTLTIEDRENWLRLNDLVLEALKVDDYESFDK